MNAITIETPIRLSLTRSFAATPERLFDAFLSPQFGQWVGGDSVTCVSCEMDPRVGGDYRMLHRTGDGQTLEHHGTYKEIARPSRLSFTWAGGCSGANVTLVTVALKAKGDGTEMTLTHEGFAGVEDAERHETGWVASFAKLTAHLAA
jgi:uncharacterized protein YndB with AHSA1/START domain